MKHIKRAACLAVLALAGSASWAQDKVDPYREGVYVSGGVGRTDYEFLFASCAFTTCPKVKFGSNSLRVAAGYGWRILGAEATLTDYGSGGSALDSRHIKAAGASVFLRVRPIGIAELSWRFGIAQAHETRVDGGVSSSRDLTLKTAGVGLGLDVHPRGTLVFQFEAVIDRKNTSTGAISLLASYRHHFD